MTDDESTDIEQAAKTERATLLPRARKQLAAATKEFQNGLSKIKDPGQRRELTASYVNLLQNYLGKAQATLTEYRGKLPRRRVAQADAPPTGTGDAATDPEIGDQADLPQPAPHDRPEAGTDR